MARLALLGALVLPFFPYRVGLALPVGIRGNKSQWTAAPSATA